MYKAILFDVADHIATITINRPEVYNAMNDDLEADLKAAFKVCEEEEEIRVVILTGAGKAFCSGQDLKEGNMDDLGATVRRRYNPIITAMRNLPKPIICRLNGVAAGAGCSFALACDMIIASEDASMIEVFINIGLVLDSGSSFFLPRYVGSLKAFELAATSKKVKAAEALSLGLVNQVVPASALDQVVSAQANYFAKAPTYGIGLIKRMLNQSYNSSLEEMLEVEADFQDLAGKSHDFKEGVAAFTEKRKPQFKGK